MSKTLGIFSGKKSTYNQLILKSLATGFKNTWQIAEYIYNNDPKRRKEFLGTDNPHNEIRQINSIICRKGSRLDELKNKGYILREKGLWKLTHKGGAVSMVLIDDLNSLLPYLEDFNPLGTVHKFKETLRMLTIGNFLLKSKDMQILMKLMEKRQFYMLALYKMKEFTNKMIKDGVNLDKMSEKEFTRLEMVHLAHFFIEAISQEIKGDSKEDKEILEELRRIAEMMP